MDQLKTITSEINKLFQTDYNCSSFNSISENQLLQILIDVLAKLNICPNTNIKTEKEKAILEIVDCLEAIKYEPEEQLNPTDFRNGLIATNKNVVHPILEWILSNKEEVRTRHYLSKYVNQLVVPCEHLCDPRVKGMYDSYCGIIDNFWNVYKENKLEKSYALETAELENDIYEMKRDLGNLKKHLRLQNGKIADISHKETFLNVVTDFCKETKRNETFSKQVGEEHETLEKLKDDFRKFERRDKIGSLDEMLEKAQCNKHFNKQLIKQLEEITIEGNTFENVSIEHEPNHVELDYLLQEIQAEKVLIQKLKVERGAKLIEGSEACVQHSKVLSRKKDTLFNEIMKLRLENEVLMQKIEQTCSLLGGDVLQGQSLKEYVGKLRERSIIYKKNKQYLNSLKKETNILEHTLEVLHLENPEIKVNLKNQIETEETIEKECSEYDLDKIKFRVRKIFRGYESLRKDIAIDDKKFRKTKDAYDKMFREYTKSKEMFDEMTDFISENIKKLELGLIKLQENIKEENHALRKFNENADYYKESLLKYSHGIIFCAGGEPYIDGIAHRLQVLEQTKDELREKLDAKEEIIRLELDELKIIENIKDLVAIKLN